MKITRLSKERIEVEDGGVRLTWVGPTARAIHKMMVKAAKLGAEAQRLHYTITGDGYTDWAEFKPIDPLQVLRQAAEEKKG